MELEYKEIKKINEFTEKSLRIPIKRKKYIEGISIRSLLITSMIFNIIFTVFLFTIILLTSLVNNSSLNISYFISMVIIFFLIYLIVLPISIISILTNFLINQHMYVFEEGLIIIYSSRLFPIFGKAVFVKDIFRLKSIKKVPILFYFNKDLRKYTKTFTFNFYQDNLVLLELKRSFYVLHHGEIHEPPKPKGTINKLFYSNWYNRYVTIPRKIFDQYNQEGYTLPEDIKKKLFNR